MPITLSELEAVQVGDAIYAGASRPYDVVRVDAAKRIVYGVRERCNLRDFPMRSDVAGSIRRIGPVARRRVDRHPVYNYPNVYVDPKKQGRFKGETNDCTVRALAIATDVDYATAHSHMAAHGRKPRGAGKAYKAYIGAELGGYVGSCWWLNLDTNRTVSQWLKADDLPARCIFDVRDHVMAVVNGIAHDASGPGGTTRVRAIFEFSPAGTEGRATCTR